MWIWTTAVAVFVMLLGISEAGAVCAGDCNGDHLVAVNELIGAVGIGLGNNAVSQCPSVDSSGDGLVAVNELVAAVGSALNGCPFTGRYDGEADVGDGEMAEIAMQMSADGSATGTLTIRTATGIRGGGALRLELPLVSLTGFVDLETGAYQLSGAAQTGTGPVPVDVSGVLPERPGGVGTLDLDIDQLSFPGTVVAGDGSPTATATPTRAAGTPTPTPTGMPASYPTPGASCDKGSASLVFSAVSGTNGYVDLGTGLSLGKGSFGTFGVGFGGGATQCALQIGDIVRRIQITYVGGGAVSGGTIALGRARGQATFDYLETPTTNPLGTRGWRADSGSLVIDAIDGGMVSFHISGAVMSPEPSFSAQTPAAGTMTIALGGRSTL